MYLWHSALLAIRPTTGNKLQSMVLVYVKITTTNMMTNVLCAICRKHVKPVLTHQFVQHVIPQRVLSKHQSMVLAQYAMQRKVSSKRQSIILVNVQLNSLWIRGNVFHVRLRAVLNVWHKMYLWMRFEYKSFRWKLFEGFNLDDSFNNWCWDSYGFDWSLCVL